MIKQIINIIIWLLQPAEKLKQTNPKPVLSDFNTSNIENKDLIISIRLYQIKNRLQEIISRVSENLAGEIAKQLNRISCSVGRSKSLIYKKSDARFRLHKCKI